MTTHTDLHPLAQSYLDRLAEAARVLPADEATELEVDISDHLREALRPDADEAEVRTVLDRLGTPHELVAAAGDPATPPGDAPARQPRFGAVEVLALVGLVGAELLFFLAVPLWLVGVALLAVSRVWSGRHDGLRQRGRDLDRARVRDRGRLARLGVHRHPGGVRALPLRPGLDALAPHPAPVRSAATYGASSRSARPRWEMRSFSPGSSSAEVSPSSACSSATKTTS